MQVRTKITLWVSSLAAVIFACAGLLLWNTERTRLNHHLTALAYEELTGFLHLSGEVFRTFKQVRRDLTGGGGTLRFDLDEAQHRIGVIADGISGVTSREIRATGEQDRPDNDHNRIQGLRREIAAAFDDVRAAARMIGSGDRERALALLETSLPRVDGKIGGIIEAAVEDERREVAEVLRQVELINRIAVWAAVAASAAGLLLTALVIGTLVLRLRTGLTALETGAGMFAAGRLDHEIPVRGRDEFATLSIRFNDMARQLLDQRHALEDARGSLERRVAGRTEELRAANAELKRRDMMRRQFLADIGHELRTPITAMRGEAEVALRARGGRRAVYFSALERIVEITGQLTRFVGDIFMIAREQAGEVDMRRAAVDLADAVTSAVEQLRTLIVERSAAVSTDLPADPAFMEGDTQRLRQLVQILLSNAVFHCRDGVEVGISLSRAGGNWRLSVEDDGPGIPESDRVQVFERFYRGNGGDRGERLQGTGLGLPIARSIVQAHGGRIWIDSGQARGTAVHAEFPALRERHDERHDDEDEGRAGGEDAAGEDAGGGVSA